jgi:hypothetical protein
MMLIGRGNNKMNKNVVGLICCLLLVIGVLGPMVSADSAKNLPVKENSPRSSLSGDTWESVSKDGWLLQWSYAYGGNGHAQFTQCIGDIDGDEVNEVIIGGYEDSGICRILYYDTIQETYVEEYSWYVPGGYYHSPSGACIVDLDEDGDLELCVSWAYSGADGVYAYTWDGVTLSTLDFYDGTGVDFVYDIYSCDYDDDSHPEVLIANDPNPGGIHVSALGWDKDTGSFAYETSWTCPSGSGMAVPMVWSGDVDMDGKTEVIADVSNLDYATAGTWALNWDNITKVWTGVPVCTSYPSGVTVFGDGVGDVDGDGTPEIGVGSYGGTPGGWLFEWDGAGYTQVWHGEYPGQEPVIESVAIGDADNDFAVEFCFGTGNVHVIAWNGTGYYEEATLTGPTNMLAGLNIGDCDSDGENEVKGCEILGGSGSEFIWKYIDATPPVTTCVLQGEMNGDVFVSDVRIGFNVTDDHSGAGFTTYNIDNGGWFMYTDLVVVSIDGRHTVRFYSVDNAGNVETEKSVNFTIQKDALPISITIKGGVGVAAVIKNIGTENLTDVSWTIALDGKYIFFGKTKSGTIDALAIGESVTVRDVIVGFGKTGIVVNVGTASANATATALLFFVLGVQ